jgi:hypothetical protein
VCSVKNITEGGQTMAIYNQELQNIVDQIKVLIIKWDCEAEFLLNNSVGSDILVGNTYKGCAEELKRIINIKEEVKQ